MFVHRFGSPKRFEKTGRRPVSFHSSFVSSFSHICETRRRKDQYWAAPVFPMNSTGRPVEYSARFGYMAFVENCGFVGERRTNSIGKFLLRRSFNVDASTRLRPTNRTERSFRVVRYFRRRTTSTGRVRLKKSKTKIFTVNYFLYTHIRTISDRNFTFCFSEIRIFFG